MCRQELEGTRDSRDDMIFTDSMLHTGMGKIDYLKLAEDYNSMKIKTKQKLSERQSGG